MSGDLIDVNQFTPPLTGYQRGDSILLNDKPYIFVTDTKIAPDRGNRHERRSRHARRKAAAIARSKT